MDMLGSKYIQDCLCELLTLLDLLYMHAHDHQQCILSPITLEFVVHMLIQGRDLNYCFVFVLYMYALFWSSLMRTLGFIMNQKPFLFNLPQQYWLVLIQNLSLRIISVNLADLLLWEVKIGACFLFIRAILQFHWCVECIHTYLESASNQFKRP